MSEEAQNAILIQGHHIRRPGVAAADWMGSGLVSEVGKFGPVSSLPLAFFNRLERVHGIRQPVSIARANVPDGRCHLRLAIKLLGE